VEAADVQLVDPATPWESVVDIAEPFVVHDALCPMTPPAFIAACIERAEDEGRIVVSVRPVTDTVKTVEDGLVGRTLDRDALLAIASPVVIPSSLLDVVDELPSGDLVTFVAGLAASQDVMTVEAPAQGRCVTTADEVRLLEALTAPQG
jgi:2-C-methyl-D-erythritol 4-phosphate cytidylyltransferase